MMEAMWTRYLPAVKQVRAWLAEDAIGDLREVRANFNVSLPYDLQGRIYNPELGGGALLDVGIYVISLASMVLGQPETIHSHAHLAVTGVDEHSSMFFTYANGATAQLSCGVRLNMRNDAFIVGSEGYIQLHDHFHKAQTISIRRGDGPVETHELRLSGNGLGHEAEEVHACLRAGRMESPVMPLDETIAILRTTDALRAAWGVRYPNE